MMLDLDHFKSINDNLGHLTGDSVLEQFGNTLLATTEGLGLSGRLGGEEFAVAAADCTFEEAIQLAERIRQRQEAHARSIRGFAGTVSIGVAWVDRRCRAWRLCSTSPTTRCTRQNATAETSWWRRSLHGKVTWVQLLLIRHALPELAEVTEGFADPSLTDAGHVRHYGCLQHWRRTGSPGSSAARRSAHSRPRTQ